MLHCNWSATKKCAGLFAIAIVLGLAIAATCMVRGKESAELAVDNKLNATRIEVQALTRSNHVLQYKIDDTTLVREIAEMFQKDGSGGLGDMRKATFTLSFRRGDTVAGEVFVMSTEHGEPEQMLYWSESGSDGVWDLSENSLARLKDIIKFEDDFAVEPEEIQ